MFMKLLVPFLLAGSLLAGPRLIPRSEVRAVLATGSSVCIVTERTVWTSEAADVSLTPEALSLNGSWTSSTVPGPGPNVIVTSWHSDRGTHSVSTDCVGRSEYDCAREHRRQLDAMQELFPPRKNGT